MRTAIATSRGGRLGDLVVSYERSGATAEEKRSYDGEVARDHTPAQSEATRRSGAPEERISPGGHAATGRTAIARAERAQPHRTKEKPAERWKNRSPQQPHRRMKNTQRGLVIKPWGERPRAGEVSAGAGRFRPTAERRGMPGGARGRPRGERDARTREPTAGAERGGGAQQGATPPLKSHTNLHL